MGLFGRIFKKENVEAAHDAETYFKTLTAYRPSFSTWRGSIYESELVRAAIDARARNISKLKCEMVGSAQPMLKTKMKVAPNAFMTWSQFLYRCSTILDMNNTLVIVPVMYDNKGVLETTGYYPVIPEHCEIIEYKGEPWLRYRFRSNEVAANRLADCAVMTKFQYKSDFFGASNEALDTTMKMIHLNNQAIQEAVKQGASYQFMAQINNFSKADDLAKERKRFTEENLNGEDAGGLLLFPNTYTNIQRIQSTAYEVPEKELESIRTNVYNYFGVNEDVLQSKAYGDKWAAFYESVIEPWSIQFSETMTKAIYSEREIALGSQLMLTANRLQYLTTTEKLNVSAQMADRGIMSINEIRDIWNMTPVEGGDRRTIRGEYYQINEDGTLTQKNDYEVVNESESD